MPGSIHVTVLEAVDLPAELKESLELVAVKVSLGNQNSTTRYRRLEKGKTAPWDSDFAFPVLNLKDKLAVAICDPEGVILTKCEIEVPSILQQGYREEFVDLSEGGRLHLKLSFVLTDDERKKVKEMRAAAQRKKEKEQKDDMMVRRSNNLTKSIERAYDFKRKEDYCTDSGLRTLAESDVEHAGKSLDNWEVLSRKKDKEVSSASLFALPQPPQPPNLKSSPSVETEKPIEVSADREKCSKNKYSSSCSTVEGVLCHSSLNHDNIVEGIVRISSPEPTVTTCSPTENPETQANSETEVGAGPLKAPIPENTKAAPIVLPEIDEQKENRPAPVISVDSNSRMGSQDDHVFCRAPEVEECMEIRLLENRQEVKKELLSNQGFSRPREENPFFPKSLPTNGFVQQDCDTAGNQVQNVLKEDRFTVQVLAPKENVASLQESSSLLQGVVAAVRMSTFSEWESIRKMPRVKEVDRISAKLSPHAHGVKDFPLEVQTGIGEKFRTVSSTPDARSPKLGEIEEKAWTVPSTSEAASPNLGVRGVGEMVSSDSSSSDVVSPKLGSRGVSEKVSIVSSSPEVVSPKVGSRGVSEKVSIVSSSPEVVSLKLGGRGMEENVGPLSSTVDVSRVDVGARGVDEEIRLQSSAPTVGSQKVGLYQLEARQTGSPRLVRTALSSLETDRARISKTAFRSHETDSPRLSKTFVKVEKNPGLLSRLLSDDCTSTEKKNSVLSSTTSVPMEGWVCVERPPMTWEDALKVAQKAREAAMGAIQQPDSAVPPPSPVKLPTYNLTGPPSPVTPMGAAKVPTCFSLPSAQDVVMCSPLPRPPKSSPIKASITAGYVKAHIEAFESGSNQTLDKSSGKVGNIMMQTETSSPTGVQMELKERRSGEEELIKWEERLRNWGQSTELKVIQEESRHRNQDTEELSWDMDDFEDSIRKDFEARLQSPSSDFESTSSRLAVPAAEVRWDVEDSTRTKWLGEVTEAPTTDEGCLDLFEDLNVEDMEESLMEEVRKDKKAVDTRVSDEVFAGRDEERDKVEDPIHIASPECKPEEITIVEEKGTECIEKVMEVVAFHMVVGKEDSIKPDNEVSDILNDPVALKASDKARESSKSKTLSKLRSSSKLVPSALAIQQLSLSGDSYWVSKGRKKSKAKARLPFLVSSITHSDDIQQFNASEAWLAKAMIDQCSGVKKREYDELWSSSFLTLEGSEQRLALSQADLIIESLCKSLEPAADFHSSREISSREPTPESTQEENYEPPSDEEKQKNSAIGGALKQVLGGAVLAAGVFVLWPKNAGDTERYHVVKTGETLSNILPEQSIDPSSRFCKLNPQVCERKTVYPGQRLRLA